MKRKISRIIKIIYKIALILFSSFMILGVILPSSSYVPYQDRFIKKIQDIGMFILTVPLLFFIGSMFGCFKKIKIMSDKRFKVKLIITSISMLICFILNGILLTTTYNNYSEEYIKIMEQQRLEVENKELAKKEEEKKKQEELIKKEEERKKQEELAKQEEEKKKQEELAKQEDEIKSEEPTINDSEFKSAIGNIYTGVTLYAEENGQMEPYFTVLDRGKNVSNLGASVIKNGVLVKEINSGDTYWKDVDRMVEDSISDEEYIIKYYVKSDDPYLP